MAEKKMTQVQALEIAVAEMANDEAREIIAGMIEKRKNVSRKPRINKEAEAFRAELVKVIGAADHAVTNKELAEHFGVKPQKVSNNIAVLEKAGTVKRIRSEKPSGKDTFVLA